MQKNNNKKQEKKKQTNEQKLRILQIASNQWM